MHEVSASWLWFRNFAAPVAQRPPARQVQISVAREGDFGLANEPRPGQSIVSDRGNPLGNSESDRQPLHESLNLFQQLVRKQTVLGSEHSVQEPKHFDKSICPAHI